MTGPEGGKDIGAVCDPTMESDCKAGLYCQPECQNTTGRCYRLCDSTSACGTGSVCGTVARSNTNAQLPFTLCSLVQSCDPIGQTGCPQGFACYPNGGIQTECDCPGVNDTGASCQFFVYDCIADDQCVSFSNGSSSCFVNCSQTSGCAKGSCNVQPSATYGYCM
jgi:hypothetical protein